MGFLTFRESKYYLKFEMILQTLSFLEYFQQIFFINSKKKNYLYD